MVNAPWRRTRLMAAMVLAAFAGWSGPHVGAADAPARADVAERPGPRSPLAAFEALRPGVAEPPAGFPPVESPRASRSSAGARAEGDNSSGPRVAPIPAELWEQVRQAGLIRTVKIPGQVSPFGRGALVLAAVGLLAGGLMAVRLLGRGGAPNLQGGRDVLVLPGLAGATAALLIAAAGTGNLYLHAAAACGAVVSGFAIAGWLLPQIDPLRRWLQAPPRQTQDSGDRP